MQNIGYTGIIFQTHETPLHYCARAGNTDVMLEIVKQIGPGKTQVAVNKQSKVCT